MDAAFSSALSAMDLSAERPFRVGNAYIDTASRDATFNGTVERLQPQNLKVLLALARQRGKIVTRDELIKRCWEDRIVGDDVINRSISTLRHFAERVGAFKIETIPRAGYRLVEATSTGRTSRWVLAISAALAFVFIAAVAAYRLFPNQPLPAPVAIAISLRPFSSDQAESATQTLAIESHNALAQMISDGSYPIKLVNPPSSVNMPEADYLISGDLTATADAIVATVKMEDTASHVVIFAHKFEATRDKAKMLPDQIGADVASALSTTAPYLILERRHPSDPAISSALFRRGALPGESDGALQAYRVARRVAPKAPNSVIAQLALALTSGKALNYLPVDQRAEVVALGRQASDRARTLAPEFGDVYIPWCLLHSPVRMTECEESLRRGVHLDPDSPWAGTMLGELLAKVGRNRESLEHARLALARDPYAELKISHMVRILEETDNVPEAGKLYRQSLRWFPKSRLIFWQRLSGITERGDYSAIEQLEKEFGRSNLPSNYEPVPALIAAVKRNSLADAKKTCPRSAISESFKSIQCMLALARLGDLNAAYEFAASIYPPRVGRTMAEEQVLWLRKPWSTPPSFITSPAAAPMRRDPRYLQLAQRVGLLVYWGSGRLPDFCHNPAELICSRLLRRRDAANGRERAALQK